MKPAADHTSMLPVAKALHNPNDMGKILAKQLMSPRPIEINSFT